MKRLLTAIAVAALSALTLAGPAQADEASFFAYLDSHGYNYSNPFGNREQALINGRMSCQYPDLMRNAPNYNPQYGLLLEAAQHELCSGKLD